MRAALGMVRRGRRARHLAVAAVLVVTAACSGAGSGGSAGENLRYGYDLGAQFTNTFDVAQSKGECDSIPLSFIYDSLVSYNFDTGEIEPELATEWEIVDGAEPGTKSIVMTLRDGVTFSDGTPFDAEAVKAGLEQNMTNDQLSGLRDIESIEVVDDLTVRINLSNDLALKMLYSMSTGRDSMIMAPGSFETADRQPVGTGPFTLESFEPGRGITLTKNPDYWGEGYDFPGIEFTQVGTGPPAVTALKAEDLDLIRFEAGSLAELESDPDVEVVSRPTEAYLQLQFRIAYKDGRESPFENKLVRQAIRHAIDTAEINEVVQADQGELATQPLPSTSPGYEPAVANAYPYDPQRAKQLLAQAGYPDGFEFTMAIPGPGIKNMADMATLIQDQLEEIGVTAKIEPIRGQDIATQYYIGGGADAFSAARLASTFYPGAYFDQWGNFQFVAIWNGAERDDITDLMKRAQASQDPAETAALVRQAAKIASDEALEVPIAFMPQFLAYDKSRVGGTILGQTNICNPPDLSGLTMKSE